MQHRPFFVKINTYTTCTFEKVGHKFATTSVIFTKLLKVNKHPVGKNSPNLVTLA
jgi:hypothetical protein